MAIISSFDTSTSGNVSELENELDRLATVRSLDLLVAPCPFLSVGAETVRRKTEDRGDPMDKGIL